MSLAAVGAFVRLLNYQFSRKCVPKCDSKICRIIRALPSEWEIIREEVLSKFEDDGSGGLINLRMEKERLEREEIREKRIEAGRAGNAKRWQSDPICDPICDPKGPFLGIATTTTTTTTSLSSTKTTPPKPPKGGVVGFEDFWRAYPKKVGKGAAEKAFAKAIKEISQIEILEAVRRQSMSTQWQKEDGQFIPHPATWLNQQRWADDLSVFASPKEAKNTPPAWLPSNWREIAAKLDGPEAMTYTHHTQVSRNHRWKFEQVCRGEVPESDLDDTPIDPTTVDLLASLS